MITINLIGYGNVGQHIEKMLVNLSQFRLQCIYSRSKFVPCSTNLQVVHTLEELPFADLTIISVKDDAIGFISNKLPYENSLVVHTSGSQPLNVLATKNRRGVWYPLQTFSKQKQIDYSKIPFFIEIENQKDALLMENLTQKISTSFCFIDSEQRQQLHISAVFACNFVNHLLMISEEIARKNNIPFQYLLPLIKETVEKIEYLSPKNAQTGPAIRKDFMTIQSHLQHIESEKYKKVYEILTNSIIHTYEL